MDKMETKFFDYAIGWDGKARVLAYAPAFCGLKEGDLFRIEAGSWLYTVKSVMTADRKSESVSFASSAINEEPQKITEIFLKKEIEG